MDALLIFLICIILFISSFINGLTGFGGAIVFQTCWSVLASWGVSGAGELRPALALVFLLGPVQALQLGPAAMRSGEVRWELVVALLPGTILATYAGTALIDVVDQNLLKKFLGLLFFAFALWQLTAKMQAMRRAKLEEERKFIAEVTQSAEPVSSSRVIDDASDSSLHDGGSSREFIREAHVRAQSMSGVALTEFDVEGLNRTEGATHQHDILSPSASGQAYVQMAQGDGEQQAVDASTASSHAAVAPSSPDNDVNPFELEEFSQTLMPGSMPADTPSLPPSSSDPSDAAAPTPSSVANTSWRAPPALPTAPPSWTSLPVVWGWLRPWLSQSLFQITAAVGVASGLLQGLFGTGGPPQMMLFSYITVSKGEVRGTSIWLGVIQMVPRFFIMLSFGIFSFSDGEWLAYLLLPPMVVLGTSVGNALHARVDVGGVLLVLQALILLSTISLTDAFSGSAFGNIFLVCYAMVAIGMAAAVVYIKSMHYLFVKERPHLAARWAEHEEATRAKAAAGQHADKHALAPTMTINPDGSVTAYSVWHV